MLAIHGGAGNFGISSANADRLALCRTILREAMETSKDLLDKGGTSLEAVAAAIVIMEDSPVFNAGRGAVFTHEGGHQLDAAIMSGPQQEAGAVAGVSHIKNPIVAARAVLEVSEHVLLAGVGAEQFAKTQNLALVDASYFSTQERRKQLASALDRGEMVLDHEGKTFGTVGAVALDQHGQLAAGTSTGGMTNKRFGRIGDTPIVGAGTFADDWVAVSCTGHGEFFMRYAVAHEVAARMRLLASPLAQAATTVVEELAKKGGGGGLIAVDRRGNIALPMNTTGMYRGWIDPGGQIQIAVFADEASP